MSVLRRPSHVMRIVLTACAAALIICTILVALPDTALADSALPAPKSVKAQATKQCTVKVSWSKVSGADGYNIYWSKNKNKGYKSVGTVAAYATSFTHKKALAGVKNYYKVVADHHFKGEGARSKAAVAKVGSTFKNAFVKFTIPKYWRGKVYVSDGVTNRDYKSVYIRDIKTTADLAWVEWIDSSYQNGGDIATHPIKSWKRGRGYVSLWVRAWPMHLYYSKFLGHGGNPSFDPYGFGNWVQLTNAETNRLIKLQTGGKLNYKKVKNVPNSRATKYADIADKYVAKNLKLKVVR